jgi:hypothetical protein
MMKGLNGQEVRGGLDFILSHFQVPIWPRTVSTAATYGAQVLVYSEEEAAQKFAAANLLDCRLNAYPAYTHYKGINRQAPNFIFIDLDRCNFTSDKAHALALDKTLKNIKDLDSEPTVLWSGNGYHVYLPINAFVLEQEEVFAKFDQPSKRFLRFAARHLSNYKSDPNNNPSLKSCMVRIPGSRNSKCITKSEVKTIQKWDGHRLPINYLLRDFRRYLIGQRIRELKELHEQHKAYRSYRYNANLIQWIERLLLTPIHDYRKLVIWHILAPYLITKRGLSYVESYSIISDWLDKCKEVKRLDFAPHCKIQRALNSSKDFLPISKDKLKTENDGFYHLLQDNGVLP